MRPKKILVRKEIPKMTVLGFLINNFVVLTENKLLDENRPDIFLGLDFHNEYGCNLKKCKVRSVINNFVLIFFIKLIDSLQSTRDPSLTIKFAR